MHRIVAMLSRAVGGAYRVDLQACRRTRGHAVVSAKVFWPWNAAVYRPVQSPDGEPRRVGRFWRIDAVEGHPRPAGSRRRGDLGELLPVRGADHDRGHGGLSGRPAIGHVGGWRPFDTWYKPVSAARQGACGYRR